MAADRFATGGGRDPDGGRRAAVAGHPVGHSLSPVLHRAAYASLGLTGWQYELRDVTAADLPALLAELDRSWAGLSLTMPLKQAVLEHLDVLDPLARTTGVVNTVVVQPGRLLVGFNTDVHGIVAAVREVADVRPARATVLGGRATASSALAALGELGCTDVVLAARHHGGPGSAVLAAARMGLAPTTVRLQDAAALAAALHESDLVVSTLPGGVADPLTALLPADLRGRVLLDVVYDPWPSALVAAWRERGGTVVPGYLMLLHQAVGQVRLMTGRTPDPEPMRVALEREIAAR